METPIILRTNGTLKGKTISHYTTDDAVRMVGDNVRLIDCKIEDTKPEVSAHEDMVQLYNNTRTTNGQFFGAVSDSNLILGNVLTSLNGSQGIGAFDGGFTNIDVSKNIIATTSDHEITLGGVFSGRFSDNRNHHGELVRILLENMRIGGGHPDRFWVTSFVDRQYEPLAVDSNHPNCIDVRGKKVRQRERYIDNFDLGLFQYFDETTKYDHDGFNEHFEMILSKYEAATLYYKSDTMLVENGHIHIDDIRNMSGEDIDFWQSRYQYFTARELRSKDGNKLIISIHALDMLQRIRTKIDRPIVPNSAYRTATHNRAVGSRNPYSDHTYHVTGSGEHPNYHYDNKGGLATGFDLPVFGKRDAIRLETLAIEYGFNAIGRYPRDNFIHIGMRKPKASGRLYWWGKAW